MILKTKYLEKYFAKLISPWLVYIYIYIYTFILCVIGLCLWNIRWSAGGGNHAIHIVIRTLIAANVVFLIIIFFLLYRFLCYVFMLTDLPKSLHSRLCHTAGHIEKQNKTDNIISRKTCYVLIFKKIHMHSSVSMCVLSLCEDRVSLRSADRVTLACRIQTIRVANK